jgi:hypothetical protein
MVTFYLEKHFTYCTVHTVQNFPVLANGNFPSGEALYILYSTHCSEFSCITVASGNFSLENYFVSNARHVRKRTVGTVSVGGAFVSGRMRC